ncbi:DNA replication licensing factor mcm10 [Cytospora mali]|uniref:DNA replication licensing factor mcm10 n=1 Tax=Cytospora mali TaxID=578113 RepID=A0A194VZX4_CYTMA|nr:DNA replication licensing factor mcm10 [Valsa mali]
MSSHAPGLETQWPPRSPREALLGTPGGREKYRQMIAQRSSSPSPSKPRQSSTAMGDPMDLDDDDDEETLQLKLQQIQAQLRLKKLRKDRARAQQEPQGPPSQNSEQDNGRMSRPDSASTIRPGLRIKEIRRTDGTDGRPRSQATTVEVPASPVRKAQPPPTETSPSRVLLGIDKGLKGKDISLKRAPSLRRLQDEPGESSQSAGGYLRRSRTPAAPEEPRPPSFSERLAAARTEEKTRHDTRAKAARSRSSAFDVSMQEMEDYKTKAVDIPEELSPRDLGYTREEIMGNDRWKSGNLHRSNTAPSVRSSSRLGAGRRGSQSSQTQAASSFTSATTETEKSQSTQCASFEAYSGFHLAKRILPHQVVARATSGKTAFSIKDLLRQVKAPDWSLPDEVIDSVVFAIVASKSDPRHHKPQYDAETRRMKPSDRGKYMVLTLVDLQYEIELFLFNSGFERFWKLSTGTVVAILNPDIMPPPPGRQDTGRFSLTINSDADTILEIGTARDLGYCKSVKADGNLCNSWVNARRTEHCEFHTNTALSRTRSARMEINSTGGLGNGQVKGKDYNRSQDRTLRESADSKRKAKIAETHGAFDWDTRTRYFMNGGSRGQSAASLIDRDGIVGDTRERAEGLKRRLAAKEKERDIAKKLGEMGSGGMGGEYMRISGSTPIAEASTARTGSRTSRFGAGRSTASAVPSASSFKPDVRLPGVSLHPEDPQRKTDARSLGLLPPRGSEMKISLSPIKRKRQDSTQSSNSSSFDTKPASSFTATNNTNRPAGGFGWGTSLRDKLSRMKTGERLSFHNSHNSTSTAGTSSSVAAGGVALRDKDRSPVRKKTRFVTEKGIREAGRESLPGSNVTDKNVPPGTGRNRLLTRQRQQQAVFEEEDDDDELVVI